jgi:hypothetical protein
MRQKALEECLLPKSMFGKPIFMIEEERKIDPNEVESCLQLEFYPGMSTA